MTGMFHPRKEDPNARTVELENMQIQPQIPAKTASLRHLALAVLALVHTAKPTSTTISLARVRADSVKPESMSILIIQAALIALKARRTLWATKSAFRVNPATLQSQILARFVMLESFQALAFLAATIVSQERKVAAKGLGATCVLEGPSRSTLAPPLVCCATEVSRAPRVHLIKLSAKEEHIPCQAQRVVRLVACLSTTTS
jgi:hypothetical protein